jgi:hypothetical protein
MDLRRCGLAATPWGFFRNWWVLAKFGITLVQLYPGIFVLSSALTEAADTARGSVGLVVGAGLMAGAIAFQAWLSVAKPWGTVGGGRRTRAGTAPAWVFAMTAASDGLSGICRTGVVRWGA